jgi:DNA primase
MEGLVERVREENDIVEVIGEYVSIKKQGKNYIGLCPFHQEKTPSFTVSPEKQLFYCFGCHVGGDIYKFVQLWENTDFKGALEILANRKGISLNDDKSPRERKIYQERKIIYQVLKIAAQYYYWQLAKSPEGAKAREYCVQRGIRSDIIYQFGLGYAASGWDDLLRFFRKRKIIPEILEKAGLVLPGKEGGHYDRFRQRLMFPISDKNGRVVAFGGRVLDDSLPKYINSPETSVYSKGKNLFGFHLAREAIRKKRWALMVEGYLDAITLYQYGWRNVVASLGTALTAEQAQLLARHARRVLIAYDADTAGQEATLRSFRLLKEAGCQVLVILLPEGYDPDSYVKEKGNSAFAQCIKTALPLVEFQLSILDKKYDCTSVEGKVQIIAALVPFLIATESVVERELLVRRLSEHLRVSEESIWSEIRRFRSQTGKAKQNRDRILVNRYNIDQGFHNQPINPSIKPAHLQAQTILLGLCLNDKQARGEIIKTLSWEEFAEGANRELAKAIWQLHQESKDFTPAAVLDRIGHEEAKKMVACLSIQEESLGEQREKKLQDCLAVLKKHQLQKQIKVIQAQIISSEQEGKSVERENLLLKLNALLSELRNLS